MDKKLKLLFDYQRFEQNPRLAKLIRETENTVQELSDDDLFYVSAAGIPETIQTIKDKNEQK